MACSLWAQTEHFKEALERFKNAKNSRDSISSYIKLAYTSRAFSLRKAIALAKEGIQVAKRAKDTLGIIKLLNIQASAYVLRSDYDSATRKLEEALSLQRYINDSSELATSYSHFGFINRRQHNYSKALDYHLDALKIRFRIGDWGGISVSYNNIGDVYADQGKYERALSAYQEGIKYALQGKDDMRHISNLADLALVYYELKNYPEAIHYINEAIKVSNRIGGTYKLPEIYTTLARIHQRQKKYDQALNYLNKAIEYSNQSEFVTNDVNVYGEMSKLYWELGKRDVAISCALKGLENAIQHDNVNLQLQLSYTLYEYYKAMNNISKALEYYIVYRDLKELANERQQNLQLAELETQYELDRLQREHQARLAESERFMQNQRILLFTVFIALVASIALILILIRNNRVKKQHNETLVKLNKELKRQQESILSLKENLERTVEKRTEELRQTIDQLTEQNQDLQQFSYIISHNIRSPIARIAGLVDIIKIENNGSHAISDEVIMHLEKAVKSLDTVIRDLNQILSIRKGINKSKEIITFQEVLEWVTLTLENEIVLSGATIKADFSQYPGIYSIKAYVQSIMYNLISNAIKYRKPNVEPEICVRSFRKADYVCLEVQDNGIGIDLQLIDPYKIFGLYQRMHTHVEGKGLGLYLVKSQVEALNGKIELESELNKGAKFTIYFPAHTLLI
ncbi:MAG: tetratricopeptide repeat protein [Cytophagales bacterium]|nr:tetratricopeptide repeat-containing sensor histidine kinase [Bernardetiaceae bacterium]MDW8204032.1 tetratricopeptide repeat protein [Cytophagales bacterium]